MSTAHSMARWRRATGRSSPAQEQASFTVSLARGTSRRRTDRRRPSVWSTSCRGQRSSRARLGFEPRVGSPFSGGPTRRPRRRRCDSLSMSLSITAEAFDSPDARRLIAALDAALTELYPLAQRFGPNLKAEHLASGRGTFLVARDDGRAVGCGAVRLLDSTTAEVKRMYVEPERRGSGVGWAVLASLEAVA